MSSEVLTIAVTVKDELNGTRSVHFALTSPVPPPEGVEVSGQSISLGVPRSSTDPKDYLIRFSLDPSSDHFFVFPFVLWVKPPGSVDLNGVIVIGEATTTDSEVQPKTCDLPVSLVPKSEASQSFEFFLSIGREVGELGIFREVFIVDPTIVTDPDPG